MILARTGVPCAAKELDGVWPPCTQNANFGQGMQDVYRFQNSCWWPNIWVPMLTKWVQCLTLLGGVGSCQSFWGCWSFLLLGWNFQWREWLWCRCDGQLKMCLGKVWWTSSSAYCSTYTYQDQGCLYSVAVWKSMLHTFETWPMNKKPSSNCVKIIVL